MKKMVATLVLSFASLAAFAAPPTDASVEELLKITNAQQLMVSMQKDLEVNMRAQIDQMKSKRKLTEREAKALDALPGAVSKIIADELSWEKWKSIYLGIYKESFEQSEIDGLIAFYKTPAGQAFVKKMPIVMQKSLGAAQQSMGPVIEKINAEVMKTIKAAKAQ